MYGGYEVNWKAAKSVRTDLSSLIDPTVVMTGNAIILTEKGEAFTWDEKMKRLSGCHGHNSQVTAIAMCSADERFAASYSPEKYHADKNDRKRRDLLDNQKLVRGQNRQNRAMPVAIADKRTVNLLIRPFSSSTNQQIIGTIPGIDASVFRWQHLNCDEGLLKMLERYPH